MTDSDFSTDHTAHALARWTALLARRRAILTLVLIITGLFFSYTSRNVRWQADVLTFFSADSDDVQGMQKAAAESGVATQLRFDIHPASSQLPNAATAARTREAARQLAAQLEKSDAFQLVWSGLPPQEMAARYAELAAQGPTLLDESEQSKILADTADTIVARFAHVREHLADPDGEILLRRLTGDPLGISGVIAAKLAQLSPGGTMAQTEMSEGMLTARDSAGREHIMLITQPKSLASDAAIADAAPTNASAADTMQKVDEAVAAIEKQFNVEIWVVGAHRGYVENATRVKTDVAAASAVGGLFIAAAIALFFAAPHYRTGWRVGLVAAAICMVPPVVGIGLALGIAGILHAQLPLLLLGFAGLLTGSTTDYGIQMIAECRRICLSGWQPNAAALAARRVLAPVSMSVVTSVTGFLALALSQSPGIRALGLFVAAATLCIWVITFLILPAYLGPWIIQRSTAFETQSTKRIPARFLRPLGFVAFLLAVAILGNAALGVRFSTDPRALDGSSQAMRSEEAAFYQVWGNLGNRAVVLARGKIADETLQTLANISNYLNDQRSDGLLKAIISPASILPDDATAAARAAAWQSALSSAKLDQLKQSIQSAAQANGMKPQPFLDSLNRITTPTLAPAEQRLARSPAALMPGIVESSPNSTAIAIIVEMPTLRYTSNPESLGTLRDEMNAPQGSGQSMRLATAWAAELRERFPDVTVLSGNILLFDATQRARAEGERLAPWCLLAILLPLCFYFRSLRRAWVCMICLLVGFVFVLGAAQLFGGGMNLLAIIPVLMTLGVTIDYGIYAAWSARQPSRSSATFLCALTTTLGAASLLPAAHPALKWLGLTLVAGLIGGYLASIYIAAPLFQFLESRRDKSVSPKRRRPLTLAARWATNLALIVLTLALVIPALVDWKQSREKPDAARAGAQTAIAQQRAPRTFQSGDSWMRWHPTTSSANGGLWEIFLAGTPQQRGSASAALAGPIDVRIESEMLEELDTFLPGEWSRYLIVKGTETNMLNLQAFVPPEYQEEIYASAVAYRDPYSYLAPAYPRILTYHALHDISQMLIDNPLIAPDRVGCTGVISLPAFTGGNAHLLLARNFDFEGGESFGRQKSITFVIPRNADGSPNGIPFAHVAWPGLSGVVTGMNREKIALFIDAAATKDFRRIGTPTIFMARNVLEQAHNLDEAERIIRDTQVFVSDIITVADGKTGQARIFEKSPAATAAYDVADSAVVANHLVTPTFADDPVNRQRRDEGTTTQRYARARQLLDRLAHNVTVDKLANLLRDKQGLDDHPLGMGNRNAIDGLIACHGVIMDATEGKMWVAAWPFAEGQFVAVDVLAMLDHGAGDPNISVVIAPNSIPEDSMMHIDTNGLPSGWDRFLAGRAAVASAQAALAGTPGQAALDAALANADEAIRQNPDYYLGHEIRGRVLQLRGDNPAAKKEFTEALRLDPPYAAKRTDIQGLIKKCDTSGN